MKGIRESLKEEGLTFYAPTSITREDIESALTKMYNDALVSSPTYSIVGLGFLKSWRKEYGDESFYNFVTTQYLMMGSEVYNYIDTFLKEYKSHKKQKKKLITADNRNRSKTANKDYGNRFFWKKFKK